jgi:hypothetical protein
MTIPHAIRRFGAPAGVSAAATVAVLVILEIVLRIAAPGENTPHWERDRVVGWRGRPSYVGTIPARFARSEYSHNSGGFRDSERHVEKADGVTRILCIGDSFTWGWGVPEEAVYTRALERLLGREGAPVEVVNCGVGGYDTVQSLVLLIHEGFALDPDVVIHQATANDLPVNAYGAPPGSSWEHPYAERSEEGNAIIRGTPTHPLTPVSWIKYHVCRHSRLASLVRLRVARLQASQARRRAPSRPAADAARDPGVNEDFRLFTALVRRMEDECAGRGVRLILLADIPAGPERVDYWRAECGGIESRFVHEDLVRWEEATGLKAFIPFDGHWTEDGHAWIAQCLADVIMGGE